VWEPSALPQILTVVPHQFYKYEAYCRAAAHVPAVRELRTASIREIERIRNALVRLRGSYYYTYDKVGAAAGLLADAAGSQVFLRRASHAQLCQDVYCRAMRGLPCAVTQ
jgi:hypothetical protein